MISRRNMWPRQRLFRSLVTTTLLASAALAQAAVVFDQPYLAGGGLASQLSEGYKAFDDFALAAPTAVTHASWTGVFFNPGVHETVSGFLLEFWADSRLGTPGALLFSRSVAGDANETFRSDRSFPSGIHQLDYDYDTDIAPVPLSGGVRYWLSIQPVVRRGPQWAWAGGTGGDGASYLFDDAVFATGRHDGDLSFSLSDANVPEPPLSWLLPLAVAGCLASRRARRATPLRLPSVAQPSDRLSLGTLPAAARGSSAAQGARLGAHRRAIGLCRRRRSPLRRPVPARSSSV